MKVALVGVTGHVGSRLADELLRRGHLVTGIARHVDSLVERPGLTLQRGDAADPATFAPLLAGHDAVISAMRFVGSDPTALIAAVKQAGVPRLLVVGGAGSLHVASGELLLETPRFPPAAKPEAVAGKRFLDLLQEETSLDWTFLSPSANFAPGERTGHFRLGDDQLLVAAEGSSHVSMEDFAIAMVDELEQPRHDRRRFTVGN